MYADRDFDKNFKITTHFRSRVSEERTPRERGRGPTVRTEEEIKREDRGMMVSDVQTSVTE